jgi:hypothetical protein
MWTWKCELFQSPYKPVRPQLFVSSAVHACQLRAIGPPQAAACGRIYRRVQRVGPEEPALLGRDRQMVRRAFFYFFLLFRNRSRSSPVLDCLSVRPSRDVMLFLNFEGQLLFKIRICIRGD